MTKPPETKERFIELRGSGMTLTNAAKELGIAYNTAVNWERELKETIDAAKDIRQQEMLELFRINKQRRIEILTERLETLNEVASKKVLSYVSPEKIYSLLIQYSKAPEVETREPKVAAKESDEPKEHQKIPEDD